MVDWSYSWTYRLGYLS